MVAMTMALRKQPIPRQTRRDQILAFIIEFTQEEHRAPSSYEIGVQFGIAHQTVDIHVLKLLAEGRLIRTKRGSRKVPKAQYIPPDEE